MLSRKEIEAKQLTNCIGYVYHELDIDSQECCRDIPNLAEILELFDEVAKPKEADAVGILNMAVENLDEERPGPPIIHLALFESDKNFIRHRRMINGPVRYEFFYDGLSNYLQSKDRLRVIYLARKK